MNIFGSKSGHLNNSKYCKIIFIFLQFLLYLMIFLSSRANLGFSVLKKTSNIGKSLEKNLSNIQFLKLPLLESKMFTVHWPDFERAMAGVMGRSQLEQRIFFQYFFAAIFDYFLKWSRPKDLFLNFFTRMEDSTGVIRVENFLWFSF